MTLIHLEGSAVAAAPVWSVDPRTGKQREQVAVEEKAKNEQEEESADTEVDTSESAAPEASESAAATRIAPIFNVAARTAGCPTHAALSANQRPKNQGAAAALGRRQRQRHSIIAVRVRWVRSSRVCSQL